MACPPEVAQKGHNRETVSDVQTIEGQECGAGGGAGGERLVAGRWRNGTLLGATVVSAGGVGGLRFRDDGVWSGCAGTGAGGSASGSSPGSGQCAGLGPSATGEPGCAHRALSGPAAGTGAGRLHIPGGTGRGATVAASQRQPPGPGVDGRRAATELGCQRASNGGDAGCAGEFFF